VAHSSSYPQLQLDRQLCFPLYAATRAVTKQYNALLGDLGLTYPQYLVLLVLGGTRTPARGQRARPSCGSTRAR
jgi:hypothetical protein